MSSWPGAAAAKVSTTGAWRFTTNMAESPHQALDILLVGNTSTGKSALINKMIYSEDGVAKEAYDEQCKETLNVRDYHYSVEGVNGKIWDTPGLQDGMTDVGISRSRDIDTYTQHISDMKKGGFDKAGLVLYCIKLNNTRFQPEDRETIKNLTEEIGKEIWERTIFVMTFTNDTIDRLERKNRYRPGEKPVHEVFKNIMSNWRKVLHKEVQKAAGVSSGVAESIPVVPAGYEPESIEKVYLEDGNDWIESLWNVCKARKPQRKPWPHDSTRQRVITDHEKVQKLQKEFTSVMDNRKLSRMRRLRGDGERTLR